MAERISYEQPRAVFTNCYGHTLSLAASGTMKQSRVMKNALDTTHEITKLIKFSPKRDSIFRGLKAEHNALHENSSAGIRVLCPTKWTVKADSLHRISYKQLLCIA